MALERTVTVSNRTILLVLLLLGLAALMVFLWDVLLTVFVAMVLAASMDPSIVRLERRGVPRPVALAIIFFGTVGLIVAAVVTFVPVIVDQGQQFVAHLPEIYRRNLDALRNSGNGHVASAIEGAVRNLSAGMGQKAGTFFGGAINAARGLLSVFGVIVLTFYLAMQQQQLKALALELSPPRWRGRVAHLLRRIKMRLGHWLLGQLLLGLVIAVLSYTGLMLLHVRFALVLALVAGFTELIPVIGPIVGAIPAIIVAASDRPILGLWVALMYIVIQQLENHLLVPRIMANATGLNPVTVLVAILVMARLAGVVGVFIAVPASVIVQVLFEDWIEERRIRDLPAQAHTEPAPAER